MLVAEERQCFGPGANPGHPGVLDCLGKDGRLAQKAVAWDHGVGLGILRNADQTVDIEIGRGALARDLEALPGWKIQDMRGVGPLGRSMDAQSGVAEQSDRGLDAHGDLAAVGDEDAQGTLPSGKLGDAHAAHVVVCVVGVVGEGVSSRLQPGDVINVESVATTFGYPHSRRMGNGGQ